MKQATTLPITNLRTFYNEMGSDAPLDRDCYLFLDSTFALFAIAFDSATDEFVALTQPTNGSADYTVYEIARSNHIDACNEACTRGLYFDLNHHLDPETDPSPQFVAA